jgi:hypothetical protein
MEDNAKNRSVWALVTRSDGTACDNFERRILGFDREHSTFLLAGGGRTGRIRDYERWLVA